MTGNGEALEIERKESLSSLLSLFLNTLGK